MLSLAINFQEKDEVLKLHKNLYSLKDASKMWFKHYSDSFTKMEFVPSKIDPYLLFSDDTVIVCYVDDVLIF